MKKRVRKQLIQFIEYWIGGNAYFISAYATFALMYGVFGWSWWQAKIVSDIIGRTLFYVTERYWVFAKKGLKKHEGRNMRRFVILNVVNIAIDYAIVGGLVALGVTPFIGMLVAAGFFTVWNYAWFRFWVFC